MAPRPRTIRNRDGSVTTKRADGVESTKYKNGVTVEKDPAEGTVTRIARDGSKVVEHDNGALEQWDKDGNLTYWKHADGSIDNKLEDGSWFTQNADGSTTTIKDDVTRTIAVDGTVTISRDSDHSETVITKDGRSTTTYPDHTIVVTANGDSTTEFANGRKVFVDGTTGTTIEVNKDGSTRQSNADGSVYTRSKTGVETFEKDGAKTVRPNSGYEETTLQDGSVIRVFPGGLELHMSPDGDMTWGPKSADASLGEGSAPVEGFVSTSRGQSLTDPFADGDVVAAGDGSIAATDDAEQVGRYISEDEWRDNVGDGAEIPELDAETQALIERLLERGDDVVGDGTPGATPPWAPINAREDVWNEHVPDGDRLPIDTDVVSVTSGTETQPAAPDVTSVELGGADVSVEPALDVAPSVASDDTSGVVDEPTV